MPNTEDILNATPIDILFDPNEVSHDEIAKQWSVDTASRCLVITTVDDEIVVIPLERIHMFTVQVAS